MTPDDDFEFELPTDVDEELRSLARVLGVSFDDLIAEAIEEKLESANARTAPDFIDRRESLH